MTETSSSTAGAPSKPSAPSTLLVRREVRHLPAGDQALAWYGKAIAVMSKRPSKDPTSWSYQAAIHGTHKRPLEALWNECKHGTWYFVAWHRMFVYYFEQIVRAAVVEAGGPASWTLPYWNYGLGGEHASIPDPFRNPTVNGSPNPLYVKERAAGINQGARLPAAVASDARALARPHFTGSREIGGGITTPNKQFWSETGALEQTPHNDVHNAVGAGGWMADPDLAAQDPIFWLHHTNIDRIWAVWIAKGHVDPTDARWTEQRFDFFDAKGEKVSKSCAEVRDTIADLGYTYDELSAQITRKPAAGMPPPPPPTSEPEIVGASERPVSLIGNAEHVPVAIDARAKSAALGGAAEPQRIFLNVENIEAEQNPGTVYGIYVNLPENPNPEELAAHHAGNVSFFGIERARDPRGDEHGHGLRVSAEITDLVRDLKARGKWDEGQLNVTFRPIGLIPPEGAAETEAALAKGGGEDPPVQVGRVSLSYV